MINSSGSGATGSDRGRTAFIWNCRARENVAIRLDYVRHGEGRHEARRALAEMAWSAVSRAVVRSRRSGGTVRWRKRGLEGRQSISFAVMFSRSRLSGNGIDLSVPGRCRITLCGIFVCSLLRAFCIWTRTGWGSREPPIVDLRHLVVAQRWAPN